MSENKFLTQFFSSFFALSPFLCAISFFCLPLSFCPSVVLFPICSVNMSSLLGFFNVLVGKTGRKEKTKLLAEKEKLSVAHSSAELMQEI